MSEGHSSEVPLNVSPKEEYLWIWTEKVQRCPKMIRNTQEF